MLDRTLVAKTAFAIAAFRNQVAVTALSQPVIPAGAKTKAGAIQIAETANGQLKDDEDICVEIILAVLATILQQDVTYAGPQRQPTCRPWSPPAASSSDRSSVEQQLQRCRQSVRALGPGPSSCSAAVRTWLRFSFPVLQQSTAGTGKLVIDNMNFITPADAAVGPVLFNVYGFGQSDTSMDFQATVSNAKIGVAPKLNIAANSALGLNPTSGYTMKTPKYQTVGKYVTWKFTGGPALAGQRVNILVAKKVGGAWGGPVYSSPRGPMPTAS